jgi:hypothetical protein
MSSGMKRASQAHQVKSRHPSTRNWCGISAQSFDCRVITSFCHLVHFFSSPSEGDAWISEREGTFLLSVAEAHELGRQVNLKRFGALLTSARDKAKR